MAYIFVLKKPSVFNKVQYSGLNKFLHWMASYILVVLAWILFRANTLGDALVVLKGICTNIGKPILDLSTFLGVTIALSILFTKEIKDEFYSKCVSNYSVKYKIACDHFYIAAMIAYILLLGVLDSSQFIYFQF